MTTKSPAIDFKDWVPRGLNEKKIDIMIRSMAGNEKMQTVDIHGDRLLFNHGWATEKIEWKHKLAVQKSPEVVSMLLRSCKCIKSLDLRCLANVRSRLNFK